MLSFTVLSSTNKPHQLPSPVYLQAESTIDYAPAGLATQYPQIVCRWVEINVKCRSIECWICAEYLAILWSLWWPCGFVVLWLVYMKFKVEYGIYTAVVWNTCNWQLKLVNVKYWEVCYCFCHFELFYSIFKVQRMHSLKV